MRTVLVRFSSLGVKSGPVRKRMKAVLRQRVEDRLEYEELGYDRVSERPGRIVVFGTGEAERAAEKIRELPGVASVSPAIRTGPDMEEVKKVSERFEIGESFGVRANTANIGLSSREVEQELGAHIEDVTGSRVDLDDPETWIRVDLRGDNAYVFSEKLEGPEGFPVGSEEPLAALISGGIDSPVAAHQVMTRGSDITPIYFYNRPIAAEDHLMRFESSIKKLERFNPGKKWNYYVVDMNEVNQELMEVGKGRMVVHRRIMFQTAEKIAEREGLTGLVTGESIGQKSSQTPRNLEASSEAVSKPVHRPLLTWSKNSIVEKAKEIGTFEDAKISSACRSMAPDKPATEATGDLIEEIEDTVDTGELVRQAVEEAEKTRL
ncbi:MAG: tRNA sulfurtransferase [Candidatus Nanohaloarchaea archaeon]